MRKIFMLLTGVAALPVSLLAQEVNDSILSVWEKEFELNEVVVVANRPVLKQAPDGIVYMTKNDPYALGLNGVQVLDRIPRISVINDQVSVAGKSSVKYIIDGHLLEMPDEGIALRLKNLQSTGIEKIELLTTPPAKYAAATNVAYISITTRNESHGTRGNIWGNGTLREDFSYLLGGNISHTTRKVELSADASWQDTKGINDLDRTYSFSDYIRTSDRTNRFTNRNFGANGLFKYKFNSLLSAGVIVNFSMLRLKSNILDETIDNSALSLSKNISPSRPNNAITLTAFGDWAIGGKGKMLSLTYNIFNRHNRSFSDITTREDENEVSRLTDEGANKYRIHSLKLDAALPFSVFRMDAGAAYTGVNNRTDLYITDFLEGNWVTNPLQSNSFNYNERTAAVYVSGEKNFSNSFFGKLGLRYEHTDVKGTQHIDNMRHNKSYGYLFPSLNLSWNNPGAGRFSISYSMGITRPNFGDLNPFRYYTTVSDYFTGNPDLDPSISHNAEINYSFKGIYAVLYNSYNHNAIGNITRFTADGSQYTFPENCLNTNKTGLYASYNRSLFAWWNLNVGGEVFYSMAKSEVSDFKEGNDHGWSGKLELNTSWILNRQKTLILNVRFSHYFPWKDRMTHYSSISLIGCDLRYALLNNRLNLALAVNDPFGWNITRTKAYYKDYIVTTRNDIHSHAITFRVSWSFGGNKVNNVYRDTKERESNRSY
ncbi:MAG: outer membrane beta-barrel family protein [Muribaculaceae bacterium]|nr:outer membrane beta-barrel family protein [Muribaculaceae bacterium]